jgi:multiple sugar transport system ATP-binding protein
LAGVRLKAITKKYGAVVALNHLSLDIDDGEFVVMLGPSGSGKSTALFAIAGLETADEGEIYIGERMVNQVEPKDRDIALVFQNYALYPHMTAEQNIAFPLRMRKLGETEIRNRVKRIAESLKIYHLLARKPAQMSGGEAQRVALARAMVREPVVFLMDEPLSNLDANLRLHMRVELKRIQKELKVTTVYVTHDQAEAMTMGDRIAILRDGALQQFGTPDEIYSQPRNSFVASFVGSPPMNLIDGELKLDGHRTSFSSANLIVQLPESLSLALARKNAPTKVSLGIRPEDLSTKAQDFDFFARGEVYVVEPLGSHSIVDVKLGDTIVKVQEGARYPREIGDEVDLRFREEGLHVFDAASGEALA